MQGIHTIYPVSREISADIETPVSAFLALKKDNEKAFFLESVEMEEKLGRYSFLAFEPELEFIAKGNSLKITFQGETEEKQCDDPISELKEILSLFKEHRVEGLPPLLSGLMGYFSYDSIRYFEKLPDIKKDTMNLPDIYLVLPKILIAFDHIKQKLIFVAHTYDPNEKDTANQLIDTYEKRLMNAASPGRLESSSNKKICLTSNTKKENFIKSVLKAKEYIKEGDIFQVVLSQRLQAKTELPPFNIYRKLRMINPSPYMFYMDFNDFQIIGSSPEVMVKRNFNKGHDEVLVRPIAGTRERGANREDDLMNEKDLLSDTKELAEHTMLLDLARNDVGRISKFATVKVENPFHIERFSHVMHIVSDVTGEPNSDYSPLDIIGATSPAGTVSGSPKVRAMEIIEELEPEKRGIYAGSIGYIDFSGNFDLCIALRTLIYKDGISYIQAGAGIVYDSVPENEYNETLNKAKALIKAII